MTQGPPTSKLYDPAIRLTTASSNHPRDLWYFCSSTILSRRRHNRSQMTRLFAGTPFDIPPPCERCGNVGSECTCTAAEKAEAESQRQREADRRELEAKRLPPEQQTARVSVQKRKGGRKATVVEGLTAEATDLPALLTRLQAVCGTGGTVKEQRVELQGDHAAQIRQTLTEMGYQL